MAVEEVEYYSLHQGNGLSGGVRETSPSKGKSKSKAQPKTRTQRKGSNSGFTSFIQGITLGTVLLIPVGVWCWVRVEEIAPQAQMDEVPNKAKTAKGKAGASAVGKRKPMRVSGTVPVAAPKPVVAPVTRLTAAEPPPPLPIATPPTVVLPPGVSQVPQLAENAEPLQKQKKGVWRTLSSPFRGKSKPSSENN